MKPRLLRWLAASVALASAAPVSAAPKRAPEPSVAPAAREDYERARAAFKAGDYKGCVDALERAQKASPDPRFFWNSAACEKKLGHHARAMRFVERYLAAGGSTLTEQERRDAKAFMDAAAAYVARVTFVSNVDGAEVFVDDELVGTTPLMKPIAVDEGDHAVRYVRSGYRTVEVREKALGGAELRWAVELVSDAPPVAVNAPPAVPVAPVGPPPKTESPAPVAPSRSPSRLGPVLVGALGVAAAAVGTVIVVGTLSDASALEAECGTSCPRSRWEGARDRQIAGDIAIGAGAGLVAVAVVWWLLQGSSTQATRAAFRLPAWSP